MKKSSLWMSVITALAVQSAIYATPSAAQTQATTTIHTEDLLNNADLVFSGKVVDIQYKDSADGIPFTFVTYHVDNIIAGRADSDRVTLRFMGGRQQKGEVIRYLDVSDTPEFQAGDTDVLFVRKNGLSICPLVDCAQGRFRNRGGVVATEDSLVIVQTNDEKTFAVSSQAINPTTGEAHVFAKALSAARIDTREQQSPAIIAKAVQVDQLVADLKVQAREIKRFQDGSVEFKSVAITDVFQGPTLTPIAPKDATPVLVRRIATPSDFDRWEEEQVSKNNGNPVLQ